MLKKSKVLALKYRPQTFEDLIGQEVAAQTIYNSIKLNKIPNAYLFNGIRGVGKTTIARIIAKALNCKNGKENLCKENFCESCEEITNSNSLSVSHSPRNNRQRNKQNLKKGVETTSTTLVITNIANLRKYD